MSKHACQTHKFCGVCFSISETSNVQVSSLKGNYLDYPLVTMTSAFSSNDAEVIERDTDTITDGQVIQEIWNEARCTECSTWIKENNFKRVGLSLFIPHAI